MPRLRTVACHQRTRELPGGPNDSAIALCGNGIGRRTDQWKIARAARLRSQPASGDRPIQDILGHIAVFGQLATDDTEQPGVGLQHCVIAGQVRSTTAAFSRDVNERPQTGVGAGNVRCGQRSLQRGVDDVEQESDFARGRFRHIRYRTRRLLVGQAQIDPAQLHRQREDESVGLPRNRNRQCRRRIAERRRIEHQMSTATGPQPNRRVHLRCPHPRGVDHHPRRQIHGLPGRLVGEVHRVSGGRGNTHPGEDPSAVLGGRTRHRHHQSSVVDQLSVIGQQRTVEPITTHGRCHRHRLLGADPTRPWQNRGPGSGHGAQHIPGQEPGSHQCPLRTAHRRQQWHKLRHRCDQVRRIHRHQDAALDRTAAGDADIAASQVAQTAVGQLRTPPTGAEGQIVFLHQHDR